MDRMASYDDIYHRDGVGTARERERTSIEWSDPVPIVGAEILPAFPVDALPDFLAEYVSALATATQTPLDLPGVMVVAALAAAAGGRAVVEARPGWREPTNLFVGVAMAPGNRKTAVVREITEPLHESEKSAVDNVAGAVAEAKAQKDIAEQRATEARRAAARAEGAEGESLTQAAIDAAVLAESITVPVVPRLLADDSTPEALVSLMAEQHGRIALISAEGGPFDVMAGRYSTIPNLDVYLKGHAGDHLRVDRKGRTAEIIDRPALTVGVAFQPGILPKIAQREGFRARGLLARFLFSVPRSYVGRRDIGAPPVNADLARSYRERTKTLVLSLAEWTDPCILTFSVPADQALREYEKALEPRLAPDRDLGPIADWGSKLAGAVVRFSGLLHLADRLDKAYREPVTEATFNAAARIGDYFLADAIAAHRLMGADPAVADATALLDWITRTDQVAFSKRDALRANSSRFPNAADLDVPLDLLEDHGYIRRRPDPEPGPQGGRPPSPVFDVNPRTAPC